MYEHLLNKYSKEVLNLKMIKLRHEQSKKIGWTMKYEIFRIYWKVMFLIFFFNVTLNLSENSCAIYKVYTG